MKPKAAWEPEYHRVFVELCVEQKLLGNKPGTQHLLEPFQQRTGARFNKKQLKNHWDTMCKQWKIWRRLVQCTDMKWDPESNTFGANAEDWANYLQANPDAGTYRLSPPLFLKKLEVIFEGSNIDGGDDEGGSNKCKRKRRSRYHEEEVEEEEEADSGDDDDDMQMASNFSTDHDMQMASNFSTHQSKGYWSPSTHELFLDLLVQETHKGNRPNTHYPKESWRMMLETINKNSGKSYTRSQLKNHWDCTRKAWKIWCQVIAAPVMKWDPNTRTFGATEEDWRTYLMENTRATQFRRKQVPCADKLAIIFKGVIEPGNADFRPYRRKVRDHSESPQLHDPTPLSTLYINEPVTGSEDGDDEDNGEGDDDDNDDDDGEPSHIPHRRRFTSVGFAESRLQDVEIETPVCTPSEAKRIRESPLGSAKQCEYTIGECIERLDSLEEVEQGSDLYLFALDLFLRKDYREIFLQLKKPSLIMSWLLRLQAGRPTVTA